MLKNFPYKIKIRLICTWIALLVFNMPVLHASNKTTVASGNWNSPTCWSPAGVPAASDNVTIGAGHTITVNANQQVHAVTVSTGGTLTWTNSSILSISGIFSVNGAVTMNGGNISLTLPGVLFTLGAGSSFTWQPGNNTLAGASLFTNGSENFSPTSTLIIKKWYNYLIPLSTVITGSFGNLTLNSPSVSNTIVEWNQDNGFQAHPVTGTLTVDQGWVTLDKSGNITTTTIGNIVLTSVNSIFYGHYGTHPSSFTITTNSISNTGGIFYGLNDGNGNITVNVNGNFTNLGNVKIINNSGVGAVSNGNAAFNVAGTFSQSTGDTRILYNVTTLNSGTFSASFGNLVLNGGIFMGQTACHSSGGLCSINITNNFNINFSNAADKFRGTSLSSIGSTMNNARLNMTIGGNLSINGTGTSEFTSAASSGTENVIVNGNVQVNGTLSSFNYGTSAASHDLSIAIGGDLLINGGNTFLSHNGGATAVSVNGNVSVSSGSLSIKGDTGATAMNVNGSLNQSGGGIYFHNNTSVPSSQVVSLSVNGDFTQSNGTLTYDNNSSPVCATHVLNISGPHYTISGNGLITHAVAGTGTVFGQLNYRRNGTIQFSRLANSHFIQQVKQTIAANCILNIASGNLQVMAHTTASNDFLRIAAGGALNINSGQVVSNSMGTYCGMRVDSGGILRTYRARGLYDGSNAASICAANNMNFFLDANSVVEYNGSDNQAISGTGAGIATLSQHQYGILRINFNGTDNTEYTALVSSNVFVRTRLELVHGELNLNGYTLSVESGIPSAISRTGGYIKSEMNAANNTSIINWKHLVSGTHTFPFGVNAGTYIPVDFTPVSGFGGDVSVSTRATSSTDNQPYPLIANSTQPVNMAINGNDISVTDVIDRWWNISAPGFTADITLTYDAAENTLSPVNKTGSLAILPWTGSDWGQPTGNGTGSTSAAGRVSASGISSFSHLVIISHSNPLPIKLALFQAKAEGNEVKINWITAAEINNDHFDIERSRDGINFESIQQIPGAGNSNITLNYGIIDKNPIEGTSYYRLKQTDYDGHFTYSEIKSVNIHDIKADNFVIEDIGPNPFENSFHVVYRTDKAGPVNVRLSTTGGQLVNAEDMNAEAGSNRYEYTDQTGLTPGMYILTILYNDKKITQKIIKK
ncbi:MAG: T9SS type A sorting domain-containing protein [Bacteroidetes bacterium]|nr:T9SS type A sorting domain-containing protein [Bacteroidota bacterium]